MAKYYTIAYEVKSVFLVLLFFQWTKVCPRFIWWNVLFLPQNRPKWVWLPGSALNREKRWKSEPVIANRAYFHRCVRRDLKSTFWFLRLFHSRAYILLLHRAADACGGSTVIIGDADFMTLAIYQRRVIQRSATTYRWWAMAGDNKKLTRLPELTQNVRSSHGHSKPSLKISCKSVQPFSRNLADKETKKHRNRSKTIPRPPIREG